MSEEELLKEEILEIEDPEAETEEENERERSNFWGAFLVGAAVMAMLAAALVFGLQHFGVGKFILSDQLEYYKDLDGTYGKYYEIMKMIGEDPIAEKTPEEITEEDLKALVASIGDPYAQYFTAEEYKEFINSFTGDNVGVGIGVVYENEQIVIKTVFPDSPAEDAGLQPEDVILRVDGKTPETVEDAVAMITGEPGTKVTVTIGRNGTEQDYTMNRTKMDQKSVVYYAMEDNPEIGYIAILSFVKETGRDFKHAVKDLKSQGCSKVIIDLRNNGGGLTDVSVDVADYLLPAGKIMTDKLKNGTETVYSSDPSSAGIEYVVLVNENTASASEILTGAIQDNKGGTVIGHKTFGKGVTQVVHTFKDGSGVKLTVSEYYRPNGDKVNGLGITPDIEADNDNIIEIAIEELEQ